MSRAQRLVLFALVCGVGFAALHHPAFAETIPATQGNVNGTTSLQCRNGQTLAVFGFTAGSTSECAAIRVAQWEAAQPGCSFRVNGYVAGGYNVNAVIERGPGSSCGSQSWGFHEYVTAGPGTVTCPAGASYDAASNSCLGYSCPEATPAYTLDTGTSPPTCTRPDPCPANGTLYGTEGALFVGDPTGVSCSGGCELTFTGSQVGRVLSGGAYVDVYRGSYGHTGATCSAGDDPVSEAGPDALTPSCGSGQSLGYINGAAQCFSSTTGENVTQNNPTDSVAPPVVVVNPDGSRTETYDLGDGNARVDSYDSQGNPTGSAFSGPNATQLADCVRNPNGEGCQSQKSSFGGACNGGFVCSGDAAECAAAVALAEIRCNVVPDATVTPASVLEAGGWATAETSFLGEANRRLVDVTSLLQTNTRDIAASCPAPIEFSVLGNTYTLDFAPWCQIAELVGLFIMIGAGWVSIRIIVNGLSTAGA